MQTIIQYYIMTITHDSTAHYSTAYPLPRVALFKCRIPINIYQQIGRIIEVDYMIFSVSMCYQIGEFINYVARLINISLFKYRLHVNILSVKHLTPLKRTIRTFRTKCRIIIKYEVITVYVFLGMINVLIKTYMYQNISMSLTVLLGSR